MVEPYLVVCGLLLLASVAVRALPAIRHSFDDDYEDGWDLTPRELAYLRSGPYGVVLTVLAELHGEGAVDLSRHGPVRRLDPPRDLHDRLTVAVYSGLRWTRRPRLLALTPRVRRACRPLRWDLLERRLLPPLRRRVFAGALLAYALVLPAATVLEEGARGSTVLGALGIWALAALCALGPRLTVAGHREITLHRAAIARVAASDGTTEASYLTDLVAAFGVAAVREVCGAHVHCGALAPSRPSYQPLPVPVPQPAPRVPLPAAPRLQVVRPPVIFVPVEPPATLDSAVLRGARVPVAA